MDWSALILTAPIQMLQIFCKRLPKEMLELMQMCLRPPPPPLGNSELRVNILLKMRSSGCFLVWCSFHFSSCQVFAIVVFSTITAEGYVNSSVEFQVKCVFNRNEGVCHYGVGIGVIAFLASFAFLLADALLASMSNAQERKYVVMADLGFSGETFNSFLNRWSSFRCVWGNSGAII